MESLLSRPVSRGPARGGSFAFSTSLAPAPPSPCHLQRPSSITVAPSRRPSSPKGPASCKAAQKRARGLAWRLLFPATTPGGCALRLGSSSWQPGRFWFRPSSVLERRGPRAVCAARRRSRAWDAPRAWTVCVREFRETPLSGAARACPVRGHLSVGDRGRSAPPPQPWPPAWVSAAAHAALEKRPLNLHLTYFIKITSLRTRGNRLPGAINQMKPTSSRKPLFLASSHTGVARGEAGPGPRPTGQPWKTKTLPEGRRARGGGAGCHPVPAASNRGRPAHQGPSEQPGLWCVMCTAPARRRSYATSPRHGRVAHHCAARRAFPSVLHARGQGRGPRQGPGSRAWGSEEGAGRAGP